MARVKRTYLFNVSHGHLKFRSSGNVFMSINNRLIRIYMQIKT